MSYADHYTQEDIAAFRAAGRRFDVWQGLDYNGEARCFKRSEMIRMNTATRLRNVPPIHKCTEWEFPI